MATDTNTRESLHPDDDAADNTLTRPPTPNRARRTATDALPPDRDPNDAQGSGGAGEGDTHATTPRTRGRLRRPDNTLHDTAIGGPTTDGSAHHGQHQQRRLPADVAGMYVAVGRYAYARRSNPTVAAFWDHGTWLRTHQSDPDTAETLVRIAHERGFQRVRVQGDRHFRRAAWIEAESLGLDVEGYHPQLRDRDEAHRRATRTSLPAAQQRTFEHAQLIARDVTEALRETRQEPLPDQNTLDTHLTRELHARVRRGAELQPALTLAATTREANNEPLTGQRIVRGTVIEVGEAPLHFERGATRTPFVRFIGDDGQTREWWTADLDNAAARHGLKVGTVFSASIERQKTKESPEVLHSSGGQRIEPNATIPTTTSVITVTYRGLESEARFREEARQRNRERDEALQRAAPQPLVELPTANRSPFHRSPVRQRGFR